MGKKKRIGQINGLRYLPIKKHHILMKMNELQLPSKIWLSLTSTTWKKRG